MGPTVDASKLLQDLKSKIADLKIPEEPELLQDDATLLRFLKATNWNLEETERLLRKDVQWRCQYKPSLVQCEACQKAPGIHNFRQVGFDLGGRPVLYASFYPVSPHKEASVHTIAHMVYTFEQAVKSMQPGVTQWVFVVDCAGMTASSCNPRLGYECAELLANHYPERLGLAVCVKPGAIFKVIWKVVKPFLAPATKSKLAVPSSKAEVKSLFQKHFSPELLDWFMEEYRGNRLKPIKQRRRPFWTPTSDLSDKHDPRGEKTYIEEYIEKTHPCGHQPHPSIIDYKAGRMREMDLSALEATEESEELDEAEAQKLINSLPADLQIPDAAEQ